MLVGSVEMIPPKIGAWFLFLLAENYRGRGVWVREIRETREVRENLGEKIREKYCSSNFIGDSQVLKMLKKASSILSLSFNYFPTQKKIEKEYRRWLDQLKFGGGVLDNSSLETNVKLEYIVWLALVGAKYNILSLSPWSGQTSNSFDIFTKQIPISTNGHKKNQRNSQNSQRQNIDHKSKLLLKWQPFIPQASSLWNN